MYTVEKINQGTGLLLRKDGGLVATIVQCPIHHSHLAYKPWDPEGDGAIDLLATCHTQAEALVAAINATQGFRRTCDKKK